jgi:hypothetical protein
MRAHRQLSIVVFLSAAFKFGAASPLGAQVIHGKLLEDITNKPVASASMTLLDEQNGQVTSAQSNDAGDFTLRATAPGIYRVHVSKIGYRVTESPSMQLQSGDDVSITLHVPANKIELAPVVVTGNSRRPSGRLGGFYDRMQRHGFGTFISRDQIEKRRPFEVTDMLRTIPGLLLRPSRGFGYDIRTTEGCRPMVYLDGVPFPLMRGETIDNIVNPMSLEGIEVYAHAIEVPGELQRGLGRCGVIALWTR